MSTNQYDQSNWRDKSTDDGTQNGTWHNNNTRKLDTKSKPNVSSAVFQFFKHYSEKQFHFILSRKAVISAWTTKCRNRNIVTMRWKVSMVVCCVHVCVPINVRCVAFQVIMHTQWNIVRHAPETHVNDTMDISSIYQPQQHQYGDFT